MNCCLVVDDDPAVCGVVSMMVEESFDGCHVDTANNPDDAFALLAAKEKHPGVVAILMSVKDIWTEDVKKLGIVCFLGKPVGVDLLKETIEDLLS